MFRGKQTQSAAWMLRPRVTPDPARAAELERRMSALDYCPENGFHRDCRQDRREVYSLRTAAPAVRSMR